MPSQFPSSCVQSVPNVRYNVSVGGWWVYARDGVCRAAGEGEGEVQSLAVDRSSWTLSLAESGNQLCHRL